MICVKPYWRKIPGSKGREVPLPCGQCVCCRINRAREWAFRMVAESSYWPQSAFLTLTYADDVVDLCKGDLQKAFKRARRSGLKFKYYACGEYGGQNGRPHYHVAIFYDGDLGFVPDSSFGRNNGHLSWWPFGVCNLGTFTRESARYTADYLLKEAGTGFDLSGVLAGHVSREFVRTPPFRVVSLGLGSQYFEDHRWQAETSGLRFGNSYVGVPRYYRKRLVTWIDEEGVPLRNSKFVVSVLGGSRWYEYDFGRRMQRQSNVVARQVLKGKEFKGA